MTIKIQFGFSAKPWQYNGPAGWYFISLPLKMSKEIRKAFKPEETGWGRLPATATIRGSEWKTAIWFDSKRDTYLLPLKAEIRKKENIIAGKKINVAIFI
ncbi:MAG: DUF1905 domain-containing protein [Sphingobacteriales bacterium]|nr:DUF1905 domain-containing protein [Sphingobacteriales bacterium]